MEKNTRDSIHTLWDELADFDAAHTDEAIRHLMSGLCSLVGGWNANWTGAIRLNDASSGDPAFGWRPRVSLFLHASPPLDEGAREQIKKVEQGVVDPTIVHTAAGAGTFRVSRLCDMVGPEWFESAYYQTYYRNLGKGDAIWAGFPVNQDAESVFGVYSAPDRPPFTEDERDIFGARQWNLWVI